MIAQMLKERGHILLHRHQQHPVTALHELGKGPQIAQIGLAGERPQTLFHPQIAW